MVGRQDQLQFFKSITKFKYVLNLNALSRTIGINLDNKVQFISKQGFVFTSIKYTFPVESIIKSRPNNLKILREKGNLKLQMYC